MNRHINRRASIELSLARCATLFALALVALAATAPRSQAAIESRSILKSYFETGEVPTQEQFGSLIDSLIHAVDDRHLIGLRTASDGGAALMYEGDLVDGSLPFGPAAGLSSAWTGQLGFAALAFTEAAETHYGYLQIRSGEPGTPGGPQLYPMFVAYFVFETDANTPLAISSVPEPSSIVLAALVGLFGLGVVVRRRWTGGRRASVGSPLA